MTALHFYKQTILWTAVLLLAITAHAQVSIEGPACVLPGAGYQYNITGKWDSAAVIQLCITGGKLNDSGDSCYNDKPVSFIKVIWNENITAGSIRLTSSGISTSKAIVITTPLQAGSIEGAVKTQVIGYNTIPAGINCSAAAGGACSPSYAYQWQQSSNSLSWTDMPADTGQNLSFSSAATQSFYYRRRVTETSSGSVKYSDAAVVFVNPPLHGSDTTALNQVLFRSNEINRYLYSFNNRSKSIGNSFLKTKIIK